MAHVTDPEREAGEIQQPDTERHTATVASRRKTVRSGASRGSVAVGDELVRVVANVLDSARIAAEGM